MKVIREKATYVRVYDLPAFISAAQRGIFQIATVKCQKSECLYTPTGIINEFSESHSTPFVPCFIKSV